MPEVSVLIPAFNASHTITEAIESVLSQSFTDFELLVCNDYSTDHTSDLLNSFKDPRIIVINNEKNLGIAGSRNVLLENAKGNYIAWLDADDLMLPGRLEKQVNFLNTNRDIDLVSSFVNLKGYNKKQRKYPVTTEAIHAMMVFKNCIVQPAVMSRNFYVAEGIFYDTNFNYIEDYHLWWRLILAGKKFGMVDDYLTSYSVPSPLDELRKKEKYGWNAHFENLLHKRILHVFPEYDLRVKQLNIFSLFLTGNGSKEHFYEFEQIIKSLLKNSNRTETFFSEKWIRTSLCYLHLAEAKKISAIKLIKAALRYSPLMVYEVLKFKN